MDKEVERYKALVGELLYLYEHGEEVRAYLRGKGLDPDRQLSYGRARVRLAFGE